MRLLVTGGAGFIGSHLCDRLITSGDHVWCADNMRLGSTEHVAHLLGNDRFHLYARDARCLDTLFEEVKFDGVFHLAANSDIAAGSSDSRLDLELNLLTTISILEAMRDHGVKRLFLASSSAVFGESDVPLGEDHGPMRPISFYGASKLAAEAYVSAFTHAYDMRSIIMRFPNVVGGSRTTHGVVHDLFRRLGADGLLVHGDGSQLKPYLHVDDLLDAIMLSVLCWDKAPFSVYHAAAGSGRTSVRKVAEIVADGAPVFFDGKTWAGDVRRYSYADCDRLRALGWRPTLTSTDAVQVAVDEMRLKCAS